MLIAFTVTGFAQSDKLKEATNKKVEALNSQIVATDASLALSNEQREQIYNIYVERLKELKKAKKEGSSKEEIKAINKKYFKKINSEVLTQEQMKARKKNKKNKKK